MSYSAPESDILYLTSLTSSGITGYETLEKPPLTAGAEVELSQAVASSDGEVLMKAFVSPALGIESIPVGDFDFSIYGAVSAMDGVSEIVGRLYQRTLQGVETELFNFTTGEIDSTTDSPTLYPVTYSTSDIIDTAITDRLVLKMYAKTDYATDITVSLFYLGETHQSRMFMPVNISKITGGDMLAALYDADYDGITTPSTDSGGGHTIQDNGTPLAQRANLNFIGATLTDDSTDDATVVTITGGGGASSDLIEHAHTGSTDGGLLRLDTIMSPTDSTSLDSSTDMHGLLPKLSGSSDDYLNGFGQWSVPAGRILLSTISTSDASATFNSIPGIYNKLTIEFTVRGAKAASNDQALLCTINADTTDSHYRSRLINSYTSTINTNSADSRRIGYITAASAPANSPGTGSIEFIGYAETTFFKNVIAKCALRYDNTSLQEQMQLYTLEWESTAAITSIAISTDADGLVAGSTFRLYGEY
jgi:hypothetical protein